MLLTMTYKNPIHLTDILISSIINKCVVDLMAIT
jgi:hypothetical protein